jgi:hypothetical protein
MTLHHIILDSREVQWAARRSPGFNSEHEVLLLPLRPVGFR